MKTEKLVVKDVVRLFPTNNPREFVVSQLLFNIVVPNGGAYRLARSRSEATQGYLVLDVESLEFPGVYAKYAKVPPPGHSDMGFSKKFKAVVIGWRPEPKSVLEMEVVKLTDKFVVLELQYKHKTIAIGSWPLTKIFGTSDFTSKGTFAVDTRKRRIELGQKVNAIVSSYTMEEVGNGYRFRLNFSEVIPPWQDGSQEHRRARASAVPKRSAT